ncbi:MAG: dihydroorotate dehydrogenase [Chloroflexi bacterium]|nr:dihydroorotate dehydrogenase [Chloroflexota bacterium]
MKPDLGVDLAPDHPRGLRLRNPVLTASGVLGYGESLPPGLEVSRLGAFVCKGTTLDAREGNAPPRVAETPAGMLNSIGLQNIGVHALIADMAPRWATWPTPVIVNIAGLGLEEYGELARMLDGVPGVAALEVNISCPNVATGGQELGASPPLAAEAIRLVKAACSLPVLVKLSPNVTDIVAVARAVVEAGADALTLINTLVGMAVDVRLRRPVLGNVTGGLSGPAIKPVALAMVYRVAGAVRVPLIGCGGISSARDALEFILAGATAVQVGTACLADPAVPVEIAEGLEGYLLSEGIRDISQLVGAARTPQPVVAPSLGGQ